MEIYVNNAILHILNNQGGVSLMSVSELDLDSDIVYEFITKHIKKLLGSKNAKKATFRADSVIYNNVMTFATGGMKFVDLSVVIADRLRGIVEANDDIPSGGVLIAQFTVKDNQYLGILKLNHKEYYTHQTESSGSGTKSYIVKGSEGLPFSSSKLEEAAVIPYDPMVVSVLEVPYVIDGEKKCYLSDMLLECETEPSMKDAADALNDIIDELSEKYAENDDCKEIETKARMKTAIIEESTEDESISIVGIARKAFPDNEDARVEFIEMAREAGLPEDMYYGEKWAKAAFSSHSFKTDDGIVIKFPVDLIEDPESFQFTVNDDGSLNIVIKKTRIVKPKR